MEDRKGFLPEMTFAEGEDILPEVELVVLHRQKRRGTARTCRSRSTWRPPLGYRCRRRGSSIGESW